MAYKTILMLMPYFGRWPEWIDLFVESCKWNPTVDWLFFTDCGEPANRCENVRFVHAGFDEYKSLASSRLGMELRWTDPYKLCDLKPALGHIHADRVRGYDFYGYGDIDVVYGDIRKFYTDAVLCHDVVSSSASRLAGHFALFKNTRRMRNAFRALPNWRSLMQDEQPRSVDEGPMTRLFLDSDNGDRPPPRVLFRERYSTVCSHTPWIDGSFDYPREWYWNQGRLTTSATGDREFLYLHFMNWKGSRWLPERYGSRAAAWETLDRVVNLDTRRLPPRWTISERGFH